MHSFNSTMEQFEVPGWLHDFVPLKYFIACNEHIHRNARDEARKYFCVDCGRGPLCQKNCQAEHGGHEVLQVRKVNKRCAVSVDDIAKLVDIKSILTYSFRDRATCVHLASMPQASGICSPSSCEMCNFPLPDSVRFGSLSCKIMAKINPSGIISFSPKRAGEAVEDGSDESEEVLDSDKIWEMQPTDSDESYEERDTSNDAVSESSSDGETSRLSPAAVKKARGNISIARKRNYVSSGCAPNAYADADAGLAARKAAALANLEFTNRKRSHGWTKTSGIKANSYFDNHASNHRSRTEHKPKETKRNNCSGGSDSEHVKRTEAASRSMEMPANEKSYCQSKDSCNGLEENFTLESDDPGQNETCEFDHTTDDQYIHQEQFSRGDDWDRSVENDLENLDIDTKLAKDSILYLNDSLVAFGDATVSIYQLRLWFSKDIHYVGKQMYITLSEKEILLENSIKGRSQWARGVKPDTFLSLTQHQQENMKIHVKDTLGRELQASKIGLRTVCRNLMISEKLKKAKKDVDLAIECLTEDVERAAVEAIERDLADLDGALSAAVDISSTVAMSISLMRQWFSREKLSIRNQMYITLSDEELRQNEFFRLICRQIGLPRLYGTREDLETFKRNIRNDSSKLSSRIQHDLQKIDVLITQSLPEAKSNAERELESIAEAVHKAVDSITLAKPNSKGQ